MSTTMANQTKREYSWGEIFLSIAVVLGFAHVISNRAVEEYKATQQPAPVVQAQPSAAQLQRERMAHEIQLEGMRQGGALMRSMQDSARHFVADF